MMNWKPIMLQYGPTILVGLGPGQLQQDTHDGTARPVTVRSQAAPRNSTRGAGLLLVLLVLLGPCAMARADWFKGQLHIHMKGSGDDGTFETVERVVNAYRSAGYQFLAITGHNVRHDSAAHNTAEFVTLNGVELHNYGGKWCVDNPGWAHVNAIACGGSGPVDTAGVKTLQDQIDLATRLGGIAQVNHPSWNGFGENAGKGVLTTERLLATSNATLLEVRNRRDEATWDAYLSTGRQIFATMTDDNHGTEAGSNMVVVEAPSLTRENIVAALKRGSFYAANNRSLAITSLTWSGRALSLRAQGTEAAPVTKVEFIGKNGAVLKTAESGDASYTLPPEGLYVRARVQGPAGRLALTQAYFPSEEKPADAVVGRSPGRPTLSTAGLAAGGSGHPPTTGENLDE